MEKQLTNEEIIKIEKLLMEVIINDYEKARLEREKEINKLIDRLGEQKNETY